MGGRGKDGNVCGAIRKDGLFCTKPAGWGTSHPGTGRCKYHGGTRQGKKASKALLVYCDPRIAERANEILFDPDILNLRKELAVLRARFEQLRARPDDSDVKILTNLSRAIGSLAMQIHEMELGRHHYIHISVTGTIINKFNEIGMRYIPDPRMRAQIAKEVELAIRKSLRGSGARAIASRALSLQTSDIVLDPQILEEAKELDLRASKDDDEPDVGFVAKESEGWPNEGSAT